MSQSATPARPAASLILPGLVALAVLGVLIGLGTWQLTRLAWKEALIAQVDTRARGQAVPLPPRTAWPAMSQAADEYRHVAVTGTFDHGREAYLYHVAGDSRRPDPTRPRGQGYFVITPLVGADGATILVNRGFVPADRRLPASRAEGQMTGPVTVTGLIRFAEERSLFAASDDPGRRIFYTRDLSAIARAQGLDAATVAPFSIDADLSEVPGGLPRGGETLLTFPNRHLEYAVTWYGLALTLIGVFIVFARQRLRPNGRPTAR